MLLRVPNLTKDSKIELKVVPNYSKSGFHIKWRKQRKFNLFNFWKEYKYFSPGGPGLGYFHPNFYDELEHAVDVAMYLKLNPFKINENNLLQNANYIKWKKDKAAAKKANDKTVFI